MADGSVGVSGVLFGAAVAMVAPVGHRLKLAGLAAVMTVSPVLAIGVSGIPLLVDRWRRARAARRGETRARDDAVMLAELSALGLAAGLTLGDSLLAARRHLGPELRAELDAVQRTARHRGLSAALSGGAGHARMFYLAAARAVTTGAPLTAALDAHVRESRAEQQAARLARIRRLPVQIMLPLALLILPGFVLVVIGPAVLASLQRISLPQ